MDSIKKNEKGSNEANKIYHGSCPSLMMMHSDGHLGGHLRGGVQMSQPRPKAIDSSFRPAILSIPDEYFKGFAYGRIEEILSFTTSLW